MSMDCPALILFPRILFQLLRSLTVTPCSRAILSRLSPFRTTYCFHPSPVFVLVSAGDAGDFSLPLSREACFSAKDIAFTRLYASAFEGSTQISNLCPG